MPDDLSGSFTVDTQELEPKAPTTDVPPETDTETGDTARSTEVESTTDAPLSAEQLQEQLAREKARADKAEKAVREQQSRAAKLQRENAEARRRELEGVESRLKELNDRVDQGEALTHEELRRRDALMEQKFTLRLNQRDAQEHEAKRVETAQKLENLALNEMGWDEARYKAFLYDNSVEVVNPQTGQIELVPFGNEPNLERVMKMAVALMEHETKDEYANKVQEKAAQKADDLAKQKLRRALPGGAPAKQQQPTDLHDKYREEIRAAGQIANPDSWFS